MSPLRLATRTAVRPSGLAARAGLVVLVALAGLPVAGRLWPTPAVRTIAVGRVPTAVAVDARTRRVFVANGGGTTVSMLDATSGAVLATVMVAPHPSALAVATTTGRGARECRCTRHLACVRADALLAPHHSPHDGGYVTHGANQGAVP